MNQFLASVYGTEPEMEKIATESIVDGLAAQGIDINQLTDEQIAQVAQALTAEGEGGELPQELVDAIQADPELMAAIEANPELLDQALSEYSQGGEPAAPEAAQAGDGTEGMNDVEKEAMQKVAEADFLGRIMAHSLVDEVQKLGQAGIGLIEKAAPSTASASQALKNLLQLGGHEGKAIGAGAAHAGKAVGRFGAEGAGQLAGAAKAIGSGVGHGASAAGGALKHAIPGLAVGAGGAAALGGGAALLAKALKKKTMLQKAEGAGGKLMDLIKAHKGAAIGAGAGAAGIGGLAAAHAMREKEAQDAYVAQYIDELAEDKAADLLVQLGIV